MRFMVSAIFLLVCLCYSSVEFSSDSSKIEERSSAKISTIDTVYKTIYTPPDNGIPWNRERFPQERLLRRTSLDDALSLAFSYSANFITSSFGTFAQHSYLAHWVYEFSPDLYIFGSFGLWMPLYSNPNYSFTRENLKYGKVKAIIPNIGLEYKINKNSYIRLGIFNEEDILKAYTPMYYHYSSWRNSNFYP